MIIDTDKAAGWARKHLVICVPIATTFLSWFAAIRWETAIKQNEQALMIFYFAICAVSGVVSAVLVIQHLIRLGLFDTPDRGEERG